MATAEVSIGLPVVSENETYALLTGEVKDEKTGDVETIHKPASEGEVEKWVAKGYSLVNKQTFNFPKAGSVEGIHQLCPNEAELVNIFNSGLKVKLQNKARQLVMDTVGDEPGFEFQEGVVDLTEYIPEERQRRGLTDQEKLMKFAAKLSPEIQAQIKAALGGQ